MSALREITQKELFTVTSKTGKPHVVMPIDYYESLMATLEELEDHEAMKALTESESDIRAGRVYPQFATGVNRTGNSGLVDGN